MISAKFGCSLSSKVNIKNACGRLVIKITMHKAPHYPGLLTIVLQLFNFLEVPRWSHYQIVYIATPFKLNLSQV